MGAGAGAAVAFGDLQDKTLTFAGYATVDYLFTPYVSLGIEVQNGELAGGFDYDRLNRQFVNNYFTGTANFKVALGEFLNAYHLRNDFLNFIKGAYAGVGFGFIRNKVTARRSFNGNYYTGDDKSTEGLVPFNLGINFYIPDRWGHNRFSLNLNLQHTLTTGEGLDGYNTTGAEHNDMYTFASAGIKYHLGPFGLDRRR